MGKVEHTVNETSRVLSMQRRRMCVCVDMSSTSCGANAYSWHLAEALFIPLERASPSCPISQASRAAAHCMHGEPRDAKPGSPEACRLGSPQVNHLPIPDLVPAPQLLPARPRHVRVARPHLDPNFAEGWASHGPTRDQGCLACVTPLPKRLTKKSRSWM